MPFDAIVRLRILGLLTFSIGLVPGPVFAVEKANQQVTPFFGSFSNAIPIEVPPYHGLEPRLALAYSSEARNGFVGVGWGLSGMSVIERANAGRGAPRYDATDIFMLDGQELVPCPNASPSCSTGGTHATKIESYLKIHFDGDSNNWTVTGKDGTRTVFTPTFIVASGTFRWAQTSTIDTKGNTVTYGWTCTGGDCYPSTITYNGYAVTFYRENRPDTLSFATGTTLGQTVHRLKTVLVQRAPSTAIRG